MRYLITTISIALSIGGCATVSIDHNPCPVYVVGCESNLGVPPNLNGNGDAVLVMFAYLLSYDAAVYSTCEVGKILHPAPTSIVSNGIYQSGSGIFSVALPHPPSGAIKPTIDIVQPALLPADYVMIWPQENAKSYSSGAIAYGVGISHALKPSDLSMPLDEYAAHELAADPMVTNRFGHNISSLLYQEQVVLDGRPAVFGIYSSAMTIDGLEPAPLYVLIYTMRVKSHAVIMAVYWRGECEVCTSGKGDEARRMDTNITDFVDSFHVNEMAIESAK